eukprot:GHVR01101721.1.p1 GENE.GHVR01101721.1~~GHVR01101721.1.p1  ORF type:complete len:137 (-),score=56.14 GHVR01101721.1:71-481(-)
MQELGEERTAHSHTHIRLQKNEEIRHTHTHGKEREVEPDNKVQIAQESLAKTLNHNMSLRSAPPEERECVVSDKETEYLSLQQKHRELTATFTLLQQQNKEAEDRELELKKRVCELTEDFQKRFSEFDKQERQFFL